MFEFDIRSGIQKKNRLNGLFIYLYVLQSTMDRDILAGFLTSIRDAVTSNQRNDDVALPIFNPEKNDNGAEGWCCSIQKLSEDLRWSSIQTAAKAGKALRGSALRWFEAWEPETGRSWENFRADIVSVYPQKKNLTEKLTKAMNYASDCSDSYAEYAREKLRLLQNTKIDFTTPQLIELICGGISEVDIRMASLNSSVGTTSDLISLLSTYTKMSRKRPHEVNNKQSQSTNNNHSKRFKHNKEPKRCYICGKSGHISSRCYSRLVENKEKPVPNWVKNTSDRPKIFCSFCKKPGHEEVRCYHKQSLRQNSFAKNVNSTDNKS